MQVNPDIKTPDGIGTASTIVDEKIIFVQVEHDDVSVDDCFLDGRIHSFSRRHQNFLEDFEFPGSKEECRKALIKKFGADTAFLSYYEHSGCIWFVEGNGPPGADCRWDGVSFAGIWVPGTDIKLAARKLKLKAGSADRAKYMEQRASTDCETYTFWCNGEVYMYDIAAYMLRRSQSGQAFDRIHDYRFESPVYQDVCGGYYGWDNLKKGLAEGLANVS